MAGEMEQYDPAAEFLEHFGVKGMHWGVRNDSSGGGGGRSSRASSGPKASDNPKYTQASLRADRHTFGNGGVKRINDSLNKGATLNDARKRERNLSYAKSKADGFKSVGAQLGGAAAGYYGTPVITRLAKDAAFSPVTLKVMGGLFGGAPFPVKVVAANSVILARTVTSIADAPQLRAGVRYVGAVAAGTAAGAVSRGYTDRAATREFNKKNPR